MSLVENKTLRKLRAGELALGFGVHASRGSLVPILAKAAGYDWGQVETFEYGTAAAGGETITDNGVPQPYLDTSRT